MDSSKDNDVVAATQTNSDDINTNMMNEDSKKDESDTSCNNNKQQKRKHITLHEHLHAELKQLIAVTTPPPSSKNNEGPPEIRKQTAHTKLSKYTSNQLLSKSVNNERRTNKVDVVDRLLNTLLEDQTYNGLVQQQGTSVREGRIHGCVGSYWELLPPVYHYKHVSTNNEDDGDEIDDEDEDGIAIISEEVKKDQQDVAVVANNNDSKLDDNNNNDNQVEQRHQEEPLIAGGGLKLPGLDWNKTFRKGYSVLVWVRPSLNLDDNTSSSSTSTTNNVNNNNVAGIPSNNKQVLYRFATSSNDKSLNSVGVCAILGQWQAIIPTTSSSQQQEEGGGGHGRRMMLTTSVTAYTLPNSDPMSHLFPTSTSSTVAQGSGESSNNNDVDTSSNNNKNDDVSNDAIKKKKRTSRSSKRGEETTKSPTIGFRKSGTGAADSNLSSGAHVLNMEHYSKQQQQQKKQVSTTTTDPRLVSKAKKSLPRNKDKKKKHATSTSTSSTTTTSSGGGYVTSTLTLPANEWSLISIQHTHPYLRRPELIISVNGQEQVKGELGYPVLDAVVFPSTTASSSEQQEQQQDNGGIIPGLGTSMSSSPTKNKRRGTTTTIPDVEEQILLRRRGILADCTLCNGMFDNGVQIMDYTSSSSSSSSRRTTRRCTRTVSATTSVHSLALLPGPPVPDAVLAIVAERGPLGDSSSSGSGLSFLLGPVPTNPQNRDAIVALSAGHGYYGSTPDNNGGGKSSSGTPSGGGRGGIMGGGGPGRGMHELVPPRSLGIPVSIGITPGVYPGGGGNDNTTLSTNNNNASSVAASSSSDALGGGKADDNTWIGRGEEHTAHVCLQGLLGRVAWTFHSADTKTLGGFTTAAAGSSEEEEEELTTNSHNRRRIVCLPSAAPSRIGGADAVPKVGIVRPTPPNHALVPIGMEVIGNARSHNVTWNYIQREMSRDCSIKIGPSSSSLLTTSSLNNAYNLDDNTPVSFSRAIQASNAINVSLLPFRLALPHAGTEEVNDMQRTIHVESFAHLNDLLSNDGELAARLIRLISECIRCGGSSIRDEALQNGVIHALATLVRKVLIRGARLGLLPSKDTSDAGASSSTAVTSTKRGATNSSEKPSALGENFDYDKDHYSSCPPTIPSAIADALVGLIDACCGPAFQSLNNEADNLTVRSNPSRGILRIRRASDLALTALFGLAMDFDLLGNDPTAAAPILRAIASRYCQVDATYMNGDRSNTFNEDYGSLLRKQINLQYFLDCLRIRFDNSVGSPPKGLVTTHSSLATPDKSIESVASSLSDILYTMLLSTLTTAAGISVSRGERDIGALVATLTECPLGSLCAHVVTTSIARLLVKCGVMSSLCLGVSSDISRSNSNHKKNGNRRVRDPGDIALESRLGRNMLLCHYHDIVAPLLLSRSTPRFSLQQKGNDDHDQEKKNGDQELSQSIDFANAKDVGEVSYPLDWTHHWRLSLLTFAWLSSLAGIDESQTISTSTGNLLLLAAKAGSLDGAVLGHKGDRKSAQDMLAVLSHFLVLSSSREKDNSASAGKKAESISRRLSAFMPLVPGIALSLISSSIRRYGVNGDKTNAKKKKMIITDETSIAVDTLKQLLSMLSLAIQALYGSKKGGLLSAKAGSKGGVQLNRAKKVFVSGAKEYVPILLQVVSLLEEPIKLSRQSIKKQYKRQNSGSSVERRSSDVSQPSEPIQRKRTDSSDKDWVDVNSPTTPGTDDRPPSEDTLTSSPLMTVQTVEAKAGPSLGQSVLDDLCSVQDMALYAVSRLVAQAMKYGGGEASTAVWRIVVATLTDSNCTPSAPVDEKKAIVTKENDGDENSLTPPKTEKTLSKSILCHLAALVLSKFARHHDQRLETFRSPWNLETCSAVARLMDLCEEKQLLAQVEPANTSCSDSISSSASKEPRKYGIDQVRLLKALLEVMSSGRESGGWSQIKSPSPSHATSLEDDAESKDDTKKNKEGAKGNVVAKALPHSNYDMYQQSSSGNQHQSIANKQTGPSNSKLLLPILQSSVRIVCPATSIIRSEAVVITASSRNSPSTAKLLGLVCTELEKSLLCAIEGLGFPIARDIFMTAIASLRRSISHHGNVEDQKAVEMCSASMMEILKAMRFRYMTESTRKEKAVFDAYEEDGDDATLDQVEKPKTEGNSLQATDEDKRNGDDIHSEVIEKLILGDNPLPKNDADFVEFPANHDDGQQAFLSPMGWSHYKGLGAALNKCYREQASAATPEQKAKIVLSILETYIDNWDKIQIQDAAEAELVDLFDINLGSTSKALIDDFNAQGGEAKASGSRRPSSANFPSLSASDAMARFIEAQSMLRHQHQYLAFEYLLRRRFGRTAFVERLCWKTWMDCVDAGLCNGLWERAVNDGGRDFSSKIATLPIFPQFPRFIPSYLDHSPSSASMDIKTVSKRMSQSIKIVDITKKEISEEMLEQFASLDEAAEDDPMNEVFDEEEADMHFARGSSDYSGDNSDKDSIGEDQAESELDGIAEIDKGSSEEETPLNHLAIQQGSFHFAASSFSFPPDSTSLHSLGEGRRLGGGSMEEYYGSCLQVKPDCSLKCTLMLTESHLIVEYEEDEEEVDKTSPYQKNRDELSLDEAQKRDEEKHMKQALRPKAMRWNISEASHIYLRRYRLRDSALELFFIPSAGATTGGSAFFAGSRSLFIDFGPGTWGNTRRDDAANAIMRRAPMQTVKQWPDKSGQFLHEELKKLMQAWSHGAISNFDYLLSLNVLAGRSYNDICQYPVFPWVLSNYTSEEVPDLQDKANFRDMSKPIGALNEERLAELLDRFNTFDDPTMPPFMYGSHYSTSAGVVIHFLLRLHPFSSLHRQLQSGHFDVADRLFSSVQQSWKMCTGRSAAEVKELTPEFYSNPAFLRNNNEFKLGTSQEGEVLGDVVLPPWAKGSPERFVEVMRLALESEIASEMLPGWIDLIFGKKQQGKASIEANNVFFYLTYYGSVDVASIEDEGLRTATELQIAHFGQCPMQLFYRRHAKRQPLSENRRRRQTLSDLYDMNSKPLGKGGFGPGKSLPFADAPLSYWVHLGAPPPGPHAPLISIRLALADRCLAVDAKGIFHFFRWAWKADFEDEEMSGSSGSTDENEAASDEKNDIFKDKGCFVAQRELFSFRNIPRLPYAPLASDDTNGNVIAAISKTLFANRSLLLVVSDGDGKGALAMQLIDPIKGEIRGEVIVPSIHADCITSIDMDPIGTAAGQGGVGGELVIVGSADGSATLWRFISSHYWPLRPRLRMMGHGGSKIHGVAISSSLGICASISSKLCCLFDVGNAAMIRNFKPPTVVAGIEYSETDIEPEMDTTFADTSALCLSILGFVITVCSTRVSNGEEMLKEVLSLELFTVEGEHVGSHLLDQDLGMPKKIVPTVDGRAVFVCAGGGVSVHLVSSIQPLITVDKWELDESSAKQAVYDLDFGPTIARPVVAAAGCSAGSLCLHALRGISKWSQEHQRNTVSLAVGSVLALPAQTVKNALGGVSSFGSSFFGSAKEISKEAISVVKEDRRLGFFRKKKG